MTLELVSEETHVKLVRRKNEELTSIDKVIEDLLKDAETPCRQELKDKSDAYDALEEKYNGVVTTNETLAYKLEQAGGGINGD